MRLFSTVIMVLALSSGCALGQVVQNGFNGKESEVFEVATIKPVNHSKQERTVGTEVYPGGRIQLMGMPLKALICTAFHLSYWQLSGGAEWMSTVQYDVNAKPSDNFGRSRPDTRHDLYDIEDPQLRKMLQALLIDRFQLKYHFETRIGNVFLLEKNGKPLRLKPVQAPHGDSKPSTHEGSMGFADGGWGLSRITMPQLAKFASDYYLHRPVLDKTGLTGAYNYRSTPETWASHESDPTGSFIHLINEMGLRLEASKGKVEIFVIDRAEPPSPN